MPSLKTKFINFLLRNRHLFRLKLRKETVDWNTSIEDLRKQHEKTNHVLAKTPEGMTITPITIHGRKAEWLIPDNAPEDKVIFYTHGGGYVSGSCEDHRAIVSKMAKFTGIRILQFDYRLAPEHPFPAAVEDSIETYQWLLEHGFSPENIIIAGESAGGGLCLSTLVALRDKAIPLPKAGVAISPWADISCSGESYKSNAKRCLSPLGSWEVFGTYYAGDTDRQHPWLSPLFADLAGLPSLYINAGGDEALRDDAIHFAEKAKKADVEVQSRIEPGMVHCYPMLAPFFPEATQAMDEIVAFIQKYLKV